MHRLYYDLPFLCIIISTCTPVVQLRLEYMHMLHNTYAYAAHTYTRMYVYIATVHMCIRIC